VASDGQIAAGGSTASGGHVAPVDAASGEPESFVSTGGEEMPRPGAGDRRSRGNKGRFGL
jgi:hypothetical protein